MIFDRKVHTILYRFLRILSCHKKHQYRFIVVRTGRGFTVNLASQGPTLGVGGLKLSWPQFTNIFRTWFYVVSILRISIVKLLYMDKNCHKMSQRETESIDLAKLTCCSLVFIEEMLIMKQKRWQ